MRSKGPRTRKRAKWGEGTAAPALIPQRARSPADGLSLMNLPLPQVGKTSVPISELQCWHLRLVRALCRQDLVTSL